MVQITDLNTGTPTSCPRSVAYQKSEKHKQGNFWHTNQSDGHKSCLQKERRTESSDLYPQRETERQRVVTRQLCVTSWHPHSNCPFKLSIAWNAPPPVLLCKFHADRLLSNMSYCIPCWAASDGTSTFHSFVPFQQRQISRSIWASLRYYSFPTGLKASMEMQVLCKETEKVTRERFEVPCKSQQLYSWTSGSRRL